MSKISNDFELLPIYWPYLLGFLAAYPTGVLGLYLYIIGSTMDTTLLYYFTLATFAAIGASVGSHRYWSHRSFKAKLPLKLLLLIFQTYAAQESALSWSRHHRVHHKYVDTNSDPYNIKRGFLFAHILWIVHKRTQDFKEKVKTIDLSDLTQDPFVVLQYRYYWRLTFVLHALFIVIPWILWDESLINSMSTDLLATLVVHNHTFTINSWAHMYGMKPYDINIEPTMNKLVSYLTLGEGYHNFHHTFPRDYAQSEYDAYHCSNMAQLFIDFFALFGWAYDRHKVSKELIDKRRERTGDISLVLKYCHPVIDYIIGVFVFYWCPLLMIVLRCVANYYN